MEGLVALVIIIWLTIQSVALTSIVLTLFNAKWIGFGLALVAMLGGLYTGRLRFEGLLYWFFPLIALMFWCLKYRDFIFV